MRLAGRVGGLRVGREVVIERDVLAEDHHDVLDRRGRRDRVLRRDGRRRCAGRRGRRRTDVIVAACSERQQRGKRDG